MKKLFSVVVLSTLTIVGQVTAQTRQPQPKNPSPRPMNVVVDWDENIASSGGGAKVPVEAQPIRIDTNRLKPIFYNGEFIVFTVTIRQGLEGYYLYVFCVDSQKKTTCLFPNAWHHSQGIDNLVSGGEQITIPGEGNRFRFRVAEPFGIDHIYAVLSKTPIDPKTVNAQSFTKSDSVVTSVDTIRFLGVILDILEDQDSYVGEVAITTLASKEAVAPVITQGQECYPVEVRQLTPARLGLLGRLFQR